MLRQMPQDWQQAYKARLKLPEELQDVEAQYKRARDLRDQLGDMPQFQGLTREQHEELKDFRREVQQLRDRALSERGMEISMQEGIWRLGQIRGKSQGFIQAALILGSSRERDRRRNPAYDAFLIQHRAELQLFYPDLYRRQDVLRGIYQQGQQAPQPAGVR